MNQRNPVLAIGSKPNPHLINQLIDSIPPSLLLFIEL